MKKHIWNQIKNITCEDLMKALEQDGWEEDLTRGATKAFIHRSKEKRIVIHYQPKKTYGANLLKSLFKDIGWNEKDLKKLKLIK